MKNVLRCLVVALVGMQCAYAQVNVADAWARATVDQQKSSGAFMTLTSAQDTRLVSVSTPVARAEIHSMSMQGDMMQMKQVAGVDLQAGKPVEFKPGGYHIMLMDLKKPLQAGSSLPLTLIFEGAGKKRETLTIQVPVKPLSAMPAHQH